MQTGRIVQAVVLMTIVVMAASCAASKEYTSKLFAPRNPAPKDSQEVAKLRFLELGDIEPDQSNWVTTDIIMGRDTISKTLALDKLSNTFPAVSPATGEEQITSDKPVLVEQKPVVTETKSADAEKNTVAKNDKQSKKKKKEKIEPKVDTPVPTEPETVESEPVARTVNPGEVRNKKTRED